MFSSRSFLFAVIIAFLAGLLFSLALRPTTAARLTSAANQGHALPHEVPLQSLRWRVPLYVSSSLVGIGESLVWLEDAVRNSTDGRIQFQMYEPGELVPPFAITEAVGTRKVEAGLTWIGYDQGKIPASTLFSAVPFGLEPLAFASWWFNGDGQTLAEDIYARHHVKPILCGQIGPETAGWFREPIDSLEQVQGLKIRFAGLGGKVMQELGASITMLAAGEIFQALETGVIDATEFSQPITDKALGFSRIAQFNYFPGWHQPSSALHLLVNLDVWNATSAADQVLIENTCTANALRSVAYTETLQGPVLRDFKEKGVAAASLPEPLLKELKRVSEKVLNEEADKNADFKRVLESQRAFRAVYEEWTRLAYPSKSLP